MRKILIIDDDPAILRILEKRLSQNGFDVYKAADGIEGLKAAKGIRPDIIITDLVMPNMDGRAFVKEIQKDPELMNTPILVLTARVHTEEMFKIEGVERFIPKPFDSDDVLSTIEDCLINRKDIPQKCVLVVDDEYDLVEVVSKRLMMNGYEVLRSINGRTALERAMSDLPDLVIIDVMMPQMDGYTVCRLLKTNPKTKHIPVIILTARDGKDDKKMAHEVGADIFMNKPFDVKDLIDNIEKLVTA